MRKSDLLSLPVISIDEGKSLGKVTDVILDPYQKSVIALKFGGDKIFSTRSHLVQIQNIQTIGVHAVTIPHEEAAITKEELNLPNEVVELTPIGKKVITDHGEFLGICRDYYFNFPSGELTSLVLSKNNKKHSEFEVSAEQILTLGVDYVISTYDTIQMTTHMDEQTTASASQINPDELIGKMATQTVQDGKAGVIVQEGEIIAPETVDMAIQCNALKTLAFVAGNYHPTEFSKEEPSQPIQKTNQEYEHSEDQLEWQSKLRDVINNAGEDIEERLKNFLINKKPAYTVVSHNDKILKKQDEPITTRDIESITDKNDLLRLAASITASEVDDFVTSLERRFQNMRKK
ncbi:PRC-barrel domain-containing protein [Natranaerobius trueperi]|uniref:PRC-barrel domain-containing protein n=1 Tax=Natranaerobius trueperi TaxID=759412 RepID=A0A226C1A8_9FIRM|nr:PRC-barrel domain-containing protein [Natranaerobius trueperi]OWZ84802.1 hypothetical protein CDO51_01940 [Natranaerobius trueperi]